MNSNKRKFTSDDIEPLLDNVFKEFDEDKDGFISNF